MYRRQKADEAIFSNNYYLDPIAPRTSICTLLKSGKPLLLNPYTNRCIYENGRTAQMLRSRGVQLRPYIAGKKAKSIYKQPSEQNRSSVEKTIPRRNVSNGLNHDVSYGPKRFVPQLISQFEHQNPQPIY